MPKFFPITFKRSRKPRLPVVVSPEAPPSNRPSVSLPPELWGYIAAFLEPSEVSRLCLLNHVFYDAFLSYHYRHVVLHIYSATWCNVQKELALLHAMQNPYVLEKIKYLELTSQWEARLLSAVILDGSKSKPHSLPAWSRHIRIRSRRAQREKAKYQVSDVQDTIQRALSKLSHVNDLTIELFPSTNPRSLDTLWTACSKSLVSLTLNLGRHLITPDHTFGLGMTCPHLRSLNVTVSPHLLPYPNILKDLRCLIPENGGCMDEFSITLRGCQSPLVNTSFGSLRKLTLAGDSQLMPSIHLFVAQHRDTLQEITFWMYPSMDARQLVILNPSILTYLSIAVDPLLKHQEQTFPFLSQCTCLRSLVLQHRGHLGKPSSMERMPSFMNLLRSLPPSLTDFSFPGLVMDFSLFLAISQNLPNISSLTLSDCYPANAEIKALCACRVMDEAHNLLIMGDSWIVRFKDLKAHIKDFVRADLNQNHQAALSKLFAESMTSIGNCCQFSVPYPFF